MFMRGIGAVYDIEGQIPSATAIMNVDFFQAMPQLIDLYLGLSQAYLTLTQNGANLDPISQAGQLKEMSQDAQRIKNDAMNVYGMFASLIPWYDVIKLKYIKQLIEKAGLQDTVVSNSPYGNIDWQHTYTQVVSYLSKALGVNAASLTEVTSEQANFASVIASLKAQLQFAKQQLASTEATLQALRQQAAALGITSW